MSTIPFVDMSVAEIEDFPDSDERAVLLAALFGERRTHEDRGWGKTRPCLFQFVYTPDRESHPAATIVPVPTDVRRSAAAQIKRAATRLVADDEGRRVLSSRPLIHLGVAFICEASVHRVGGGPSGTARARQVMGVLADGQPFRVRRVEGHEPTVSFTEDRVVAGEAGLYRAMRLLNDGLRDAHAPYGARRGHDRNEMG
jgi:hypothetical protein